MGILIKAFIFRIFVMNPNQSNPSVAIPIAIVVGFGLIAAAIFFSGRGSTPAVAPVANNAPTAVTKQDLRPVDKTDYIKGNPNAPIMIVEYSDYDCPFCKEFHETMQRIMTEYGVGGKVAWVYRQFPIAQLHPNAPQISQAAYCVGDLGGNDAFWKFSDTVFGKREVNEKTNMVKLPEYAASSGVDKTAFNACLASGKFKTKVQDSLAEGAKAGAQGTPYSIVLVGGQQAVINGAQPYEVVKQIVDNLITQLDGGTVSTSTTAS
jgi:protein-disulfide isomerase